MGAVYQILSLFLMLGVEVSLCYPKPLVTSPVPLYSYQTKAYNETLTWHHSHRVSSALPMPDEKFWTYKCEKGRCMRVGHHGKLRKRVSFISCSMTCGDINIWPHPTLKHVLSPHTHSFSVDAVELKVDTTHREVQKQLNVVFERFLKDLRQIQKLDYADRGSEITTSAKSSALSKSRRHTQHGSKRAAGDLSSVQVKIVVQKSGDLNFSLDNDESYYLTSNTDGHRLLVEISANSYFGARHGLSTLQQLIWYDDQDRLLHTYSNSEIKDAPKFRYRGLMLDTSRHFFSVEAIKRTIMAMGLAKLNRFHWHLTDAQSFPYISRYYPELAEHGAYSESETYTEQDVREVAEFAKIYGVQVIPEIDAPAHVGNSWDWGPKHGMGELAMCTNQKPWSFFCGEPPCGQLNPYNNHTYLILQRLYEELLQQTGPTDLFHLGGDDVKIGCWAQYFHAKDQRNIWCGFMLQALASLKVANHGVAPKYVVVWSSDLTNTNCLPNSQFAVQVGGSSTWQEDYDLLDNGYNMIFSGMGPWSLDCGFGSWRDTGKGACAPYRTWQNVYKHRPWERMRLDKRRKKQLLGGEVCMWTEQVGENQLDNRLWPRSAGVAERLWTDPNEKVVSPKVFRRISLFRNRLVELGIRAEALFPKYCAQNPGECI
ncbi:probable beta-hexosaminidase fdl isoform X2 [Drosophila ananassae]|uniref:probable beta-hexosaminidase fdl isoform X2 n=1 Tax=Drosophila ananassae TaxID=7217 RepID=UPI0013A5CB14|nr:probable beta-hexosaminidase fdl isoform X2 [Drosophila ananassae]